MKNIDDMHLSHQELFENEIRTIIDALCTQLESIHILYEGVNHHLDTMDEKQEALLFMARDLHSTHRHPDDRNTINDIFFIIIIFSFHFISYVKIGSNDSHFSYITFL